MAESFSAKLKELETPLERVTKKQKTSYTKTKNEVEKLLNELNKAKLLLDPDNMDTGVSIPPSDVISSVYKKVQESNITATISNEHKEYYATISKFGKAIDKIFVQDMTKAMFDNVRFDTQTMNEVIAQHFFREGKFNIGELFAKEADVGSLAEETRESFREMYRILEDISKNKNLESAIQWAKQKRKQLVALDSSNGFALKTKENSSNNTVNNPETTRSSYDDDEDDYYMEEDGSSRGENQHDSDSMITQENSNEFSTPSRLEFKLHRLQYLHLLQTRQMDALDYARKHFPLFSKIHVKEIQKLMGCLLYVGRLEKSPYASYFKNNGEDLWQEILLEFTSSCCSLLGLSSQSPLLISTSAGSIALPKQLKVASLLSGKSLKLQPLELELGSAFQFHPIFACPVSREQTTSENPPMRLVCGHVISNTSLTKLARGGTRFKCPYCPTEQHVSKAKQVNF